MLKVLVVEDEEMIRKGIVLAVDWAALDCVVVGEAADGAAALDAVERYDPSLIITDLKMPRMDGIQMLQQLQSDFWFQKRGVDRQNKRLVFIHHGETGKYAGHRTGVHVQIGNFCDGE